MRIRGAEGKYRTKGPHLVLVTFRRLDIEDGMTLRVSKAQVYLDTEIRLIESDLLDFATSTGREITATVQNGTTARILLVIRYDDTNDQIKVADDRLAQNLLEECNA